MRESLHPAGLRPRNCGGRLKISYNFEAMGRQLNIALLGIGLEVLGGCTPTKQPESTVRITRIQYDESAQIREFMERSGREAKARHDQEKLEQEKLAGIEAQQEAARKECVKTWPVKERRALTAYNALCEAKYKDIKERRSCVEEKLNEACGIKK